MNSVETFSKPAERRDFSTQQMLTYIGLAALASVIIAIVPLLGLINYPFRLLLTIVHELGHGLAALLTGGEFLRFIIRPDGSGLATTAGGWRVVVIPAGYLSVALFGAALIAVGRSYRQARIAMGAIGVLMILLTIRYSLPGVFSSEIVFGILTTFSGIIFGAIFLWVAIRATPGWIIFLIHLVAIQAALTAFSDLVTLIGISSRFFSVPNNDAQSMAQLTFIPAIVWAVLWAITAMILVGGAIWITWIAPSTNKPN